MDRVNHSHLLDGLRKNHLCIYFCVNEIKQTLEMHGDYKLSSCLTGVFSCLNIMFDTSTYFFEKKFLVEATRAFNLSPAYSSTKQSESKIMEIFPDREELLEAKALLKEKKLK